LHSNAISKKDIEHVLRAGLDKSAAPKIGGLYMDGLHKLFQMRQPSRLHARTASLRTMAPGVWDFHTCAFLRSGMVACAPLCAMASWHALVSSAPSVPSALTLLTFSSGGTCARSSGSMGASPTLLSVTAMARISSVLVAAR
jgi:hypothetical protein